MIFSDTFKQDKISYNESKWSNPTSQFPQDIVRVFTYVYRPNRDTMTQLNI